MYQCTYRFKGKEKTTLSFTAPTIPAAHKLFLKDFASLAGEVRKVKIEKTDDPLFTIDIAYHIYRDLLAQPERQIFTL